MNLELGSLAQWASAIFAGLSFIVATLGFLHARRASKQSNTAIQEIADLKVQISMISLKFGGQGGIGGVQGGGGGGGGGAGASGGNGGSVTFTNTP